MSENIRVRPGVDVCWRERNRCGLCGAHFVLLAVALMTGALALLVPGLAIAGDVICAPVPDGSACTAADCGGGSARCAARCIRFNPFNGQSKILQCECQGGGQCQAVLPAPTPTCVKADDGTGTVHLPPAGCAYSTPDGNMQIIDGLPPASTIQIDAVYTNFACPGGGAVCSFPVAPPCYQPGGSLSGEKSCAGATLQMPMVGTGALGGFNRNINLPINLEIHTAPRLPGMPVQAFTTDTFRLFGQVLGDPDFDLLRVVAGTDFGLPSPGHTGLTQLPGGNWAVDSFFDITYRIDFVGAPGGALAGRSGSTTGTVRIATGRQPDCTGSCVPGFECNRAVIVNPDGTLDICCECTSIPCEPLPDLSACAPGGCGIGQSCRPKCLRQYPGSGVVQVTGCECGGEDDCHAEPPAGLANPCVYPANPDGTVHLPPGGCAYRSPTGQPMQIIDGLPVGSPVNIAFSDTNFQCSMSINVCSFPTTASDCVDPGGSLGGEKSCANSSLQMNMQGTGVYAGYNRFLSVPVGLEIHAAPRVPFTPLQTFNTQMFRLFGQITGDPDFDLLRIVGGTDFGLPSPGQTALMQLPGGSWEVDSFFDITYRIDFVGNPAGPFAGRSGSTTGTIRWATGGLADCRGICPPGTFCRKLLTYNVDGSIEICCECTAPCACFGDLNGDSYVNGVDIQEFAKCYIGYGGGSIPTACLCADMNGDESLSPADVALFVTKLLTDADTLCP